MEEIEQTIKSKKPKLFSKELVEIIFKLPYTKRKNLVDAKLGILKTVGKLSDEPRTNGNTKI